MLATDNRKYIKDIHFNTAEDFLQSISYGGEYYSKFGKNFIYRGHSSEKYFLLPTILSCMSQKKIVYVSLSFLR